MTATIPENRLALVFTDSDWVQEFTWTDAGEPRDFTGSAFSLAMIPFSTARRSDSFELTTIGGGLIATGPTVAIRVPEATMAATPALRYRFTLRQHLVDGEIRTLAVGEVTIHEGASRALTEPAISIGAPPTGPGGSLVINTGPQGFQIVSGGSGATGRSAYQQAVADGYEGTPEDYAALPVAAADSATAAAANAEQKAERAASAADNANEEADVAADAAANADDQAALALAASHTANQSAAAASEVVDQWGAIVPSAANIHADAVAAAVAATAAAGSVTNLGVLDARKWMRSGWKTARIALDRRVVEGVRKDALAYGGGQWLTGPDAQLPSLIRAANFNGVGVEYLDSRKWRRSGIDGVAYVAADRRLITVAGTPDTVEVAPEADIYLPMISSGNVYLTNLTTGVRRKVTQGLTIVGAPAIIGDYVVFTSTQQGQQAQPVTGGETIPAAPTGWVIWGSSSAAGANNTQGVVSGGVATTSPIGTRSVKSEIEARLGLTIFAGGVSSQTGRHIAARADAIRAQVTIPSGSIPTSGAIAVTCSLSLNASVNYSGILNGVPGALACDGSTWSFTRTTPGSAVAGSGPYGFISDQGVAHRFDGALIWAGKNNIGSGTTDVDGCITATRAIWDHVGNLDKRRLVIGHFADRDTPSGDIALRVAQVDAAYAAAYGDHHLPVQSFLCNNGPTGALGRCVAAFPGQITVSATDTADFTAGRIPLSLMADNLSHMNAFGHWAVAQILWERMVSLNLVDA